MIAVAAAAAPTAAGAAGVLVRLPGGERHLDPAQVAAAADQPAGTLLLRAAGTTAEPVAHPPALSVRRLVMLAGGAPDAISFISIARPNGTLALLGRADVADPPPFPEGPPLVWTDAGGTRYLRPLRDPSDANAADNLDAIDDDLVVRVHQGPLLAVIATAQPRSVGPGAPVDFAAQATGVTPGQAVTFRWTFGDGTAKAGQAVRHRFATPGVYDVVVTAEGTDDSGGSSQPVTIRVGAAPRRAQEGGGGRRRRAPVHGPATGTTTPSAAPRTTATEPPAPARPRPRPRPAEASPAPRRRSDPAPRGPVVSGVLVSARSLATPAAAASGGAAAARMGGSGGTAPWRPAALAAGTLLLLAIGVRRERLP